MSDPAADPQPIPTPPALSRWLFEPDGPPSERGAYWDPGVKQVLVLLNIDNYEPRITAMTYPLILGYAGKIGARVYEIRERKFPAWPNVFEKFQIWELAQSTLNADFIHYIDIDTLIHPDCMGFAQHLPRDTVAHNGADVASNRWRYTREMRRDGRNIGSCNWFTMAWDLCFDIWRPLEDMTFAQALQHIYPTVQERLTVVDAHHLIDDFTCSQNIARYGLKFTTAIQIQRSLGYEQPGFLWHQYTISKEHKLVEMQNVLKAWSLVK